MENRGRKYWEISSILDSWSWYKEESPEGARHDFINSYLDSKELEEDCWRKLAEYEDQCNKRNQRILKAIKSVKGRTFHKHVVNIIEECEGIDGMAEIVRVPSGKFQEEKHGKEIDGIWIDQWTTNMEGDSYEGIVCVKIKPDRFLKFRYKM